MNKFENKSIFIAPYTPTSKAFEMYLSSKFNVKVRGFIDKVKSGVNIYKIEDISEDMFDYIIIISPNHSMSIFNEYKKYYKEEKLNIIDIINGKYIIKKRFESTIQNRIKDYSELIDKQNSPREGIVFISKGFIDSNNKYFFLYCLSQDVEVTMITDNISQLEILKDYNLPCLLLDSEESDKKIAQAKYIVFDQANYTYFFSSRNQILIQLWHGVGLKKMSKLENITYDYFISTSDWTNESNFKNIFLSENYLNLGYPRNDIFFRNEEKNDMIFCDSGISRLLKNKRYKRVVLYMPTFREYLFNKNISFERNEVIPFDFNELNKEFINEEILFIVKFHPCVMEIFESISMKQKFDNIIFHPTQGDIYPIIKYVDILVTDYSSIAYDFLLLDRPIIFFDYDREIYEKNMGGFLFDYDKYSPGLKVKNQEELIDAIKKDDFYKKERELMRNLFFDSTGISASENIFENLIKLKA